MSLHRGGPTVHTVPQFLLALRRAPLLVPQHVRSRELGVDRIVSFIDAMYDGLLFARGLAITMDRTEREKGGR
jgi:hypothetical protein